MKIVVDCFKLVKGAGKSIGIYNVAVNMIHCLTAKKRETERKQKTGFRLIVLGNNYNREDLNIPGVCFIEIKKYDPLNKAHFILWELFLVETVCQKLHADLVIYPRGYLPLCHKTKSIVMIHDLIPFYYDELYPDYFNRIENAYIKRRLRDSAENAEGVLTVSAFSKKEIAKRFEIGDKKVSYVWNPLMPVLPDPQWEKRSYIIAITSSLPHKNAEGIRDGYTKYCKTSKTPADLIIVGVGNEWKKDLPENLKKKITCYSHIEKDRDLQKLIAEAKVMIFLSVMEGFGLPPIEAMQLGTPVICSDRMSLPEIVGDAAILVDPEDTDRIADRIDELVENLVLQETLCRRGKENIRRFDPDSRGKEYWNVIVRKVI